MPNEFIAFIDESGDEGFNLVPPPRKLSTEWFVMAAAICRTDQGNLVDAAVQKYHADSGKTRTFHFAKQRHEDRIGFINCVRDSGIIFTSVFAHKPSLTQFAGLRQSHFLFYYTAKLLIERITWYAHYASRVTPKGKVRIVFSNRGQLKRADLFAYLGRLRRATALEQWLGIEVGNHDKIKALP